MNADQQAEIVTRLRARVSEAGIPEYSDRYLLGALHDMVDAGACRVGMRSDRALRRHQTVSDLARSLARLIDHTALKPDVTQKDVRRLCAEAEVYCFASVCVNPCNVELAAATLSTGDVAVCSVVGFPLGANRTETKVAEAASAMLDGATELDMVLNVGRLKNGQYSEVAKEIAAVVDEAGSTALVKVILECALLTDEEKVTACHLARDAGAGFVKTSTGFSGGGATAQDVALMRRVVGDSMGVKASGGLTSHDDALAMLASGATRIGASASVAIVEGCGYEA